MAFALNLYHDQLGAEGATAAPLKPAHRLLYLRHGSAVVNGKRMSADEALYCDEPLALQSAGAWAQLWRWELAEPNAAPALAEGAGVLSSLRMARIISTLAMTPGTKWLLRLDQINAPAGRVADRHQHPGPGIRCLLEGSFNVQQDAESIRNAAPGDAWWETGSDTVVAWGAKQMATRFLRGMVLPPDWEGRPTGTWLSGEAAAAGARGNWKLYLDRIIAV